MSARSEPATAYDALAAIVRGDADGWRVWRHRSGAELVRLAEAHGVVPWVVDGPTAAGARCLPEVRDALQVALRREVVAGLVRDLELRRVVAGFAAAGVRALLMKGADLAHSVYPHPELRPRTDSDVLVEPDARAAAAVVLEGLGYERVAQSGGDLLMYQEPYRLRRSAGIAHVVDLHWRVFNPQRYGTCLTFADLDRDAEPRPRLGPDARGLGRVHALVLACVHRVAHHFGHGRLIWLIDARVLAATMTRDDWAAFGDVAIATRLRTPCLATLVAARTLVGADVPDEVMDRLRSGGGEEADAAFFDPAAPHAFRVLSDFRHIGGWSARVHLARQHLFPPASYMRTVYAPSSTAPLWALYARRIVRGSRRWLVRS